MTSTNLKSNFIAAFKKLLKRRWAGAVLVFALTNFSAVISSVFMLSYYFGSDESIAEEVSFSGRMINEIVTEPIDLSFEYSVFCAVLCILVGIYCLFQCPKYFGEIYNKRSCDYYYATPITRNELFNSAFLFGTIVVTLSYVSGALVNAAILKSIFSAGVIIDFKPCIAMLFALLAAFAVLLLCAVLSGKKLHYFVLAFISIIVTPLALAGASASLNNIWGVIHPSNGFAALSPAGNAINAYLSAESGGKVWLLICISAVEIIAAYAIGLIVFKRRKAEVAEVSLAGKILPFLFLAVLQAYAFMRLGNVRIYAFIVAGGLVSAVVVTLIYTAIFYKKAFTKETLITLACTGVACIIFLSAIYLPKHDSFVKYIPQADEVESVEFTVDNWNYSYYSTGIINELFVSFDESSATTYSITSKEGIEKAIALHETLVSDNVINKSKTQDVQNLYEDSTYFRDAGFEIKYHLKNGKTVSRQYCVNSIFIISEFIALEQTEELLRQNLPYNADIEKLAFAGIDVFDLTAKTDDFGEIYYENYYEIEQATEITADYSELLECIIADRTEESRHIFGSTNSLVEYYQDGEYTEVSKHNVASVVIYLYSDDASQKFNDKIANMSWEDFRKFCESDAYFDDATHADHLDEYCLDIFDEDTRTIDYLKSIGIELPNS